MVQITLKINERSKLGRIILDLIRLGTEKKEGIEVIHTPNQDTIKAIEDVKAGRTTKVKNSKDLFKQLGI